MSTLTSIIEWISNLAIPVIILVILFFGFSRKLKMYELFVEGAKDGFNVAVRIIPYLVAFSLQYLCFGTLVPCLFLRLLLRL